MSVQFTKKKTYWKALETATSKRDRNDKSCLTTQLVKSSCQKKSQTPSDPVSMYLSSLEPELQEMNIEQLILFKKKAFDVIDDIMKASACVSRISEVHEENSSE